VARVGDDEGEYGESIAGAEVVGDPCAAICPTTCGGGRSPTPGGRGSGHVQVT